MFSKYFFIRGEYNFSGFQAVLLVGVTTAVFVVDSVCKCVFADLVRILPHHT